MKVIQLVTHFDMGGAERVAINIAKSKSGVKYYMVEVVQGTSSYSEEFKEEMRTNGIEFRCSSIKSNKCAIILSPIRLRHLIKEIKPDVIQTHTEVPDLSLYLTHFIFPRLFKNIKIVRTLHNTVLWSNWKYIGKVAEKFYKSKKANVTNSKMIAKVYQTEFGADENMTLIYNGFNSVGQIPYEGIVEGKKNILFAGRFHKQKGINVLIDTIKKVNPDKFFFHIAGKGELEKELRDGLISQNNVIIRDPIFGLPKYLKSFDYVFIPSVHEGLNSLSIEASLNHTPVIINNCDGLNETVPSDYVLKVSDNSVNGYVNLFKMLETKDGQEFAKTSYAYALENFSMQKMQKEYEALYYRE